MYTTYPALHSLSGKKEMHECFCACHTDGSLGCSRCLRNIVTAAELSIWSMEHAPALQLELCSKKYQSADSARVFGKIAHARDEFNRRRPAVPGDRS